MSLKRGMAPLVATLLLISFAVALGVVIMNFGRAQVDLESHCTIDINLEFSEIAGEREVCFDSEKNDLYFVIENGINIDVGKLKVNIIGEKRAESYDLEEAQILKAGTYLTHLGYNEELSGGIKQLKIIPVIDMFEEEEICSEKALVIEDIKAC